jgi:hypothetical protein
MTNILEGCFGETDRIFAGHKLEEDRAFAWLADLREQNIGWSDAKSEIEEFLRQDGCSGEHIANQIKHAEALLRPWLHD